MIQRQRRMKRQKTREEEKGSEIGWELERCRGANSLRPHTLEA